MGTLAKSADPDQMPQKAASDQGLHCLQNMQPFFLYRFLKKLNLTPLKLQMFSSNM